MQKKNQNPLTLRRIIRALPRIWDKKPIWAHINITQKCNLSCAYCTEHDNAGFHVPKEEVLKYINKCRELGVLHIDLIGGEPLLHPDLYFLLEYICRCGMTTGLTTNGILLNKDVLEKLISAGVGNIQISIDTIHDNQATKKSLERLLDRIILIRQHDIWLRANIVICDETIDHVRQLASRLFELGAEVSFCVLHNKGTVPQSIQNHKYVNLLNWAKSQKRQGKRVAYPYFMLDYFKAILSGEKIKWICLGGAKSFYVSTEGFIHPCFHSAPLNKFLDVTNKDFKKHKAKGCEDGCGVDCLVYTSLPYTNKAFCIKSTLSNFLGRFNNDACRRT